MKDLSFFFFNDTATTEIYTLSLHDALPISARAERRLCRRRLRARERLRGGGIRDLRSRRDRKSTRLNSSHGYISYAVFCLKKKTPTASYSSPCRPLPPPYLSLAPRRCTRSS